MGLVLIEDQLGTRVDNRNAELRRARLEMATDLWDCRDEALAMLRAGYADAAAVVAGGWHAPQLWPRTLRDVAESMPLASFRGEGANDTAGLRRAKAAWVAAFMNGDVDEWAAAGAMLAYKTYVAHPGDMALLLAS